MKLFVWDLHGTLEQGNEHAAIAMSNHVLAQFGYRERFTPAQVATLYGLKWYQYFEHLLPHEPHARHTELQAACFAFSNSPEGLPIIEQHMRPTDYALDVLAAIKQSHDQVLISNTIPDSLPHFVRLLGMDDYFDPRKAIAVNLHVKDAKHTKREALEAYLKGRPSYTGIIVIGDSAGDMHLAEAFGATSYLYAHPGLPFREAQAHHRTHDLRDILTEL